MIEIEKLANYAEQLGQPTPCVLVQSDELLAIAAMLRKLGAERDESEVLLRHCFEWSELVGGQDQIWKLLRARFEEGGE